METLNQNETMQTEEKESNSMFYNVEPSFELTKLLDVSDGLNQQIDVLKANNPDLWQTILTKLKVDWTYNSNSIEGSTLTKGDTHFFLTQGLTVEGKPFKDFLDAKNHLEAIDYLYDIVANERPITEGLIKEINYLILSDVQYTPAQDHDGNLVRKKANAGEYKHQPNHVLLANGDIHRYVDPIHVADQMQQLVTWITEHEDTLHPIIIASLAHYNLVRIHPFDDGNGRGARILMNLILMKKGFFPAVIRTEKKRVYLDALNRADSGDINPFIEFIVSELIETQEGVLNDLQM
jgi:Fic family protein